MEEKNKSGLSTAGLVLAIIGMCLSLIPIVNNVTFILGILAIIFGIICLVKKVNKKKSIAAIVISIISILIAYNMQVAAINAINDINNSMNELTGNKTEEILQKHANVELGKFEVIKSEYFSNTKLVVKVTNKTTEKKSFSIHIEAVDQNGSRIADDYVYANTLTAGQSQNFECFTLVTSDKIETLKNATFKIVEVSMY